MALTPKVATKLLSLMWHCVVAFLLKSKEFWIIVNVLSVLAFIAFVSVLIYFRKKQRDGSVRSARLDITTKSCKEIPNSGKNEQQDQQQGNSNSSQARYQSQEEKPRGPTSAWNRESAAYIELDNNHYLSPRPDLLTSSSVTPETSTLNLQRDAVQHYNNVDRSTVGSPLTCDTVAEITQGPDEGDVTISITLKGSEVRRPDVQIRRTESDRVAELAGVQRSSEFTCPRSVSVPKKLYTIDQSGSLHNVDQSGTPKVMTLARRQEKDVMGKGQALPGMRGERYMDMRSIP